MNHKEMTAHIRKRIRLAGIKARVCLYKASGRLWIRVNAISFEARSPSE